MSVLDHLDDAVDHWRGTDPILAEQAESYPPEPRVEDESDPFRALVRAIVHQQVSLAAGRTIFGRVEHATDGVTVDGVLAAGRQGGDAPGSPLRAAGLSGMKVRYTLDLAERVADGRLDLDSLRRLPDDGVIEQLTAVKGIGVWSAKMHLIFHMDRPNVCPWEDLGVKQAAASLYGIPETDATAWIRDVGRLRWTPWNTLAARVLWHSRRVASGAY